MPWGKFNMAAVSTKLAMGNMDISKDDFGRNTQGNELNKKYSDVKTIEVLQYVDDFHLKACKHARASLWGILFSSFQVDFCKIPNINYALFLPPGVLLFRLLSYFYGMHN